MSFDKKSDIARLDMPEPGPPLQAGEGAWHDKFPLS